MMKGDDMKKIILKTILVLFLISSFSLFLSAETKSEKYLGKRVSCLETIRINDSYILDDQTILFKTDLGVVYINRLPAPCHGLKVADAYSYSTSINKLCKLDTIRLIESSYGATNSCGLGEFVEMKGPKNIRDAIGVLKDEGILDILVKEGAFKTLQPRVNKRTTRVTL